jgi:DNA-binding NarL/FixJ family response regulator
MREEGQRSAVVLDRHPLCRDAMAQLLERLGVQVAGKTSSGETAFNLLADHEPELFVLGLESGSGQVNGDGIAVLQRVRERHPNLRQVVLSEYDDAQHIDAAFAAGATVYCVKTAEPEDLASAIRQAFEHSIHFAGVRRGASSGKDQSRSETEGAGLTRRETEILKLVAEGHSNAQLARMLWVTEQTVKFHLSNIYRKLDVANRTEASRWAQLNGLLSPTPRSLDDEATAA